MVKANISLLIKWRWRLLQKKNGLWKEILVAKYGAEACRKVHWIGSRFGNRASFWWKDLCGIDVREEGSWFANNISRVLVMGIPPAFGWIVGPVENRFVIDCLAFS
jgi:hypothetical protein